MAQQETGKQRAARIPLDYYKKPDALGRWKRRLTWLALLLAVAYVSSAWLLNLLAEVTDPPWVKPMANEAATWVPGSSGELLYSHGPVNAVHQAWEKRCDVCHVSFQPIKQDNWLSWVRGKLGGTPSGSPASTATGAASQTAPIVGIGRPRLAGPASADQKCEGCHAGPAHDKNQRPEDVVSCGSCHRDHRGREASLINLADGDCTSCHRDLKNHLVKGSETTYWNVRAFSLDGHPEFALLRSGRPVDPGKLKFNHHLHMTPGQPRAAGGKPWALGDIADKSERERYRAMQPDKKQDKDPVELNCASCHVLDSRAAGDAFPPRSPGAYMLPVTYEFSCKACHPLTFDKQLPAVSIPHHLQPGEVNAFLWGTYVEQKAAKDPGLRQRLTSPRPLPGKPFSPEEEQLRTEIRTFVEKAERYVYSGTTTCGECHYYEGKTEGGQPKKIVPTQVKEIWYEHARFSHVAHRMTKCASCHPRADADVSDEDSAPSTQSSDVLIPGISNCVVCHAPPASSGTEGVRHNCTECHSYHNGAHPLAGVGARERNAKRPVSVEAFFMNQPSRIR